MTTRERTAVLTLLFVLGFHSFAYATWSVIALDRTSRVVVVASATCVPQQALERFPVKDLRDVQAIVVAGKGVAAAQAGVDWTRANQQLIFAELHPHGAPGGSRRRVFQ